MSAYFTDTVASGGIPAPNALLTTHTSDSGHAWAVARGSQEPLVWPGFDGVITNGGSGTVIVRPSIAAPGADNACTVIWYYDTEGVEGPYITGACIRMSADGTSGYLVAYDSAAARWRLWRLVSSGDAHSGTPLASSEVQSYARFTTRTATLSATGSDAVLITLTVDGADILIYADSDASRVTSAGYVGHYISTSSSAGASAMWVNEISASEVEGPVVITAQADEACSLSATAGASRIAASSLLEALAAGDAAAVAWVALAAAAAEAAALAATQSALQASGTDVAEATALGAVVAVAGSALAAAQADAAALVDQQAAVRSTSAVGAEALGLDDAAAAVVSVLAATLTEALGLADAATAQQIAVAALLEAAAWGDVLGAQSDAQSALIGGTLDLGDGMEAQADYVADVSELLQLRECVAVLLSALEAVRDLVRETLPGWRVQAMRWVDEGRGYRYAVIRPVGGSVAGLLRRPSFTVLLVAAADDSATAAYDAGGALVAATPATHHIVTIRAAEPVASAASDGRPMAEVAITTITT